MPDGRNHFIDPLTGFDYPWDINHSSEDTMGKTRTITHSGTTSRKNSLATTNTGLVKQQGADSPMILKLKGTMLRKSQHQATIAFWQLCNTQTIYFLDFAGNKYEVIITSYLPIRKSVAKNTRDYANAPLWIWEYELDMEVVTIIAGDWLGVTP